MTSRRRGGLGSARPTEFAMFCNCYNEMGGGFREEVFQQCLERELTCRGIPYDAKKELRIYHSQSDSRAVGFVKRFVDIRVPRRRRS